ncbi:MAG: hypothetical protein KGL77_02470 [Actinomycetales bacterium]|nr:hypothetical protein [Actinomycetales bacterium]
MSIKSPFCADLIDIDEEAAMSDIVQCACGFNYKVADLLEFNKLTSQLATTQGKIAKLVQAMSAISRGNRETAAYAASAQPTTIAAPVASPAPIRQPVAVAPAAAPAGNYSTAPLRGPVAKEPKAARVRVAISAQQWLIIGASLLVFVAGIVFVGNNLNKIPSEGFLAITLGISAATGLAGFKGRNFSVLLSNFMAAFSSVMLMMGMLVFGDMLFPFKWDTAPPTWWAVTFAVVSLTATVLAKLSTNFGWKAIAPLAFTFAGLEFTYGTVGTWIKDLPNAYPWQLLTLSVTTIALLYLLRFIKAIGHPEITNEDNRAYEEDLERREIGALNKYAQFATLLLALFGAGVTATQLLSITAHPIDALSSISLGMVWLFGAQTIDRWGGPLSRTGEVVPKLRTLAWILGTFNLALGLTSLATEIENTWLGIAAAVLVVAVLLALPLAKRWLAAEQLAISVGAWSTAATWVIWQPLTAYTSGWWNSTVPADNVLHLGAYLVAISVVFTLGDLVAAKKREPIVASLLNGAGALLVVLNFKSSQLDATWQFVAWFAFIIVMVSGFAVLQRVVGGRLGATVSTARDAISIAVLGAAGIILLVGNGIDLTRSSYVSVSLALLGFAGLLRIVAARLKALSKLGIESLALIQSHVLQGLLAVNAIVVAVSDTQQNNAARFVLVFATAAVFNYGFAIWDKAKGLPTIGFVAINLAAIASWNLIDAASSAGIAFTAVVWLSALAALAHRQLTKRLGGLTEVGILVSGLVGPFGGFLLLWSMHSVELVKLAAGEFWLLQGTFALLALTATAYPMVRKQSSTANGSLTRWGAFGYALLTLVPYFAQSWGMDAHERNYHLLVAGVVLSLNTVFTNRKTPSIGLLIATFLSLGTTAAAMANLTALQLDTDAPEAYSIWYALALAAGALLSRDQLGRLKQYLVLDAPVLLVALFSVAYAWSRTPVSDENYLRALIALTVSTALFFWRTNTKQQLGWLVMAYVSSLTWALSLSSEIIAIFDISDVKPELYSLTIAFAIAATAMVSGKLLGANKRSFQLDIPLLSAAAISLGYALAHDYGRGENLLRALIALGVVAAFTYWRAAGKKSLIWLGFGYGSGIAFAVALAREAVVTWNLGDDYPEVYSVLSVAGVLVGNAILRRIREQESTLLTWGLPFGALVLPSALATSSTIELAFSELSTLQVVRTIAVFVVSLAGFVIGVRRGNLGLTVVGVAGLSLVAWIRVQGGPTTMVELRSLVLAFALFMALALLKKYAQTGGNSLLYIGLPVAVALTPAIFNALIALGNPTLTVVDWWRFAIVLIASLALLVVGALREQAGMFFPGLIGVLVSVLPYGVHRVSNESWFLWVVLLLVAGIMVWIAVRLEQMRKVGKTSVAWLKTLK